MDSLRTDTEAQDGSLVEKMYTVYGEVNGIELTNYKAIIITC